MGLLLWFFVNRASSRSNEQIELLQSLLDQQKRQNALLRRLCEANAPHKEEVAEPSADEKEKTTTISFVSLPNVKFEEQVCTSRARL